MSTIVSSKWVGQAFQAMLEPRGELRMWHEDDEDGDLQFYVVLDGKWIDSDDEEASLRDVWAPVGLPYETMAGIRELSFRRYLKAQPRIPCGHGMYIEGCDDCGDRYEAKGGR